MKSFIHVPHEVGWDRLWEVRWAGSHCAVWKRATCRVEFWMPKEKREKKGAVERVKLRDSVEGLRCTHASRVTPGGGSLNTTLRRSRHLHKFASPCYHLNVHVGITFREDISGSQLPILWTCRKAPKIIPRKHLANISLTIKNKRSFGQGKQFRLQWACIQSGLMSHQSTSLSGLCSCAFHWASLSLGDICFGGFKMISFSDCVIFISNNYILECLTTEMIWHSIGLRSRHIAYWEVWW